MYASRDDILDALDVARCYGDVEQIERLEAQLDDLDAADESDYEDSHYEGSEMTDAEADADVLRSCGWGTDEDYGYFGDDGF